MLIITLYFLNVKRMSERSYTNDLKFGLKRELEIINLLKKTFCELYDEEDIVPTKDLYTDDFYPYDYEGTTNHTCFEMKSRRVKKNTYPTTIIPVHKIRPTNITQIFVFNFTDVCCYIEYAEELFKTFETKTITTYRVGKIDIPKGHYLIPIHLLTDLVAVL